MTEHKHGPGGQGAKARDHSHSHPRGHWRHAHRDWRVWLAVILMIAMTLAYVLTDNLALRPNGEVAQPMPETAGP